MPHLFTRLASRAILIILVAFTALYLLSFADHARQLLAFAYPLDYGEGPLLAQVEQLRAGTPLWRLYADPQAPPYLIVNYPPLYLLLAQTLSLITGSPLFAGRLISLLSALGCVAALFLLIKGRRQPSTVRFASMPALSVVEGSSGRPGKAEGRRQKAEGRRQPSTGRFASMPVLSEVEGSSGRPGKAEGRRQTSEDNNQSPIPNFQSPIPNPQFPIPNPQSPIPNPQSPIPNPQSPIPNSQSPIPNPQSPAFLALLFLTIPIVREWAVLMRVDLLGVCLGLWGLVVMQRANGRRPVLAGLLLLACLFTKPSLLAAPLAAGGLALWRVLRAPADERGVAWRDLFALGLTMGAGGALLFGLLQWASGGWFALHVVAANANRWDAGLALGFWGQQLQLRWALFAAAGLALAVLLYRALPDNRRGTEAQSLADLLMPLLYTLGGIITAVGVGKVGAYSNYFLELYAGLIWLVGQGAGGRGQAAGFQTRVSSLQPPVYGLISLLLLSLLYYPPLWDTERLRPAGLIEPSPPRLAFGQYGLWADARREAELLAALDRVNTALLPELRAAGPVVFTDMPGVAAAAGVGSRLQAFEARQLFDQALADQRALLAELANGTPPLAVLDYLGNWLTPEVVELLQRRYAQDGALGVFDLFRPVDPGPPASLDLPAGPLRLAGYSLAAPAGAAYEPGELVTLALRWERLGTAEEMADLRVLLRLSGPDGRLQLENERPLLYGVFPPAHWPEGLPIEHMQPLALPAKLPAGRYTLQVALQGAGRELLPLTPFVELEVAPAGGRLFAETGQFVPARLMRAWAELGAVERAGYPLTPAVPFAWGRLQCFERVCLELRGGEVRARDLGRRQYLAETLRSEACFDGVSSTPGGLCPGFTAATERFTALGAPISGELQRNGWIVQWTTGARLERQPDGEIGLGRLGDESLRLPPGTPYRWP